MRNRLKNLRLTLVSIFLSLAILILGFEAVENIKYAQWRKEFTAYGWLNKMTVPSRDPLMMWEYRPYGVAGDIKVNRYGFRDFDYPNREKPGNVYRIAFAGDSIILGLGVKFDEMFVRQFEMKANRHRRGPVIQALDFGIDGYNAIQVSEMIRTRVIPFSPDRIVYVMCLNDFDLTESAGSKPRYFQKPKSFFFERLDRLRRQMTDIPYDLFYYRKNKKLIFRTILEMSTMVRRENMDFEVLIVPVFFRRSADFREYPLRQIHKEVDCFLRSQGIRFYDLLETFEAQPQGPRYWSLDPYHPNPAGHALIAERLASEEK
jgi:lysophospholipase L1-like esterase